MNGIAVAYARVSTQLGQNVENQLFGLREYAKNQKLKLLREYSDCGVSGKKERRPALDELIESARRREYSVLLVHSIDRLARNVQNLLNLLTELQRYGVSVVFLRENFDLQTPLGQLMLTVLASVAQLEAQLISERIRTAMAVKKEKALRKNEIWKCGRPKIELTIRNHIIELKNSGLSDRAVAVKLTTVSKSTVTRVYRDYMAQKVVCFS